MRANMELALERACKFLPGGTEGHEARRYVANKILECAERGNGSVRALTPQDARLQLNSMPLTSRPATRAKAKETTPTLGRAEANWLVVVWCRVPISTPR
jgi:hypothetical protein